MEVIKVASRLDGAALHKIAVTTVNEASSYADLLCSAYELSSALAKELVVPDTDLGQESRGDKNDDVNGKRVDGARIGIIAKPCAEFIVGTWATWLSGSIAVPVALSFPEAEIYRVMIDADITLVMATDEYRALLENVVEKCPAKLFLIPPLTHVGFVDKDKERLETVMGKIQELCTLISGNDGALVIYTSGTTGRPKGVVHTHAGLKSQVEALAHTWECTSSDRFLHVLPLHHIHGLINSLLYPLYVGGTVDFLPKFSVSAVWQQFRLSYPLGGEVAKHPITAFTAVPTVYVRLLQGYDNMDSETQTSSAYAASQLRLMMCASSSLPLPIIEKWEALTGHRLVERYGMTEFGMGLTNPLHGERKPGYVGCPFPGVEIRVDEGDGLEPGVGELLIKSPSLFREYWCQPEATVESFTEDGYFKTGDTVRIDDGYVKILGRTCVDIIKKGGYKLSALEIEGILLEHPLIAECAVLGLPDMVYGEFVCVVIVADEQLQKEAQAKRKPVLTLEELKEWAKERMAPYKIPQQLLIWERIPRNAMGKVNKKELKDLLQPHKELSK